MLSLALVGSNGSCLQTERNIAKPVLCPTEPGLNLAAVAMYAGKTHANPDCPRQCSSNPP
eukprot:m.131753 g.131753  ORF g.131753 m.131753 type:complete len:60 (-) comp13770_c0_seq2:1445-1624(-)